MTFTDFTPFADIPHLVVDLVQDLAAGGTATPADLTDVLPFIRVNRFGGSDDRFSDTARLDLDTFDATRPLAWFLAEACRQRLLSYPHVIDSAVIDRVVTAVGPQEVPWGNPKIRRFTASYLVTVRR